MRELRHFPGTSVVGSSLFVFVPWLGLFWCGNRRCLLTCRQLQILSQNASTPPTHTHMHTRSYTHPGDIVKVLEADEDVANCVRCHPSLPVLATSGIESVVRLWAPTVRADGQMMPHTLSIFACMLLHNQSGGT